MARWYRLFGTMMTVAGIGIASAAYAQEPADPPAAAQAQAAEAPAAIQPAQDADLAAEVQQLRAELDQLKGQVAQLNSVIEQLQASQSASTKVVPATRSKRTAPAAGKKASAPATPPVALETDAPLTVLVFQDGHRTEARNYAIVGQTLWIYTEDDSKKMPLSELDVTATKNANSDRGIVFQLPPAK
jgi:TolA-binding protein